MSQYCDVTFFMLRGTLNFFELDEITLLGCGRRRVQILTTIILVRVNLDLQLKLWFAFNRWRLLSDLLLRRGASCFNDLGVG